MGGTGSGSWQRGKSTTNSARSLDVRQMKRDRVLTPGKAVDLTWTQNGEISATIRTRAAPDRLTLNYRHKRNGEWKQFDYPVYLEQTGCNLGGQRTWFRCPASGCGRRVAILYIGTAGIFACRHCYNLAYACQRESVEDRTARRANTIKRRLGWKQGVLNLVGGKPKGMHWKTFDRLRAIHDALAGQVLAGLAAGLGMMDSPSNTLRPSQ
jgi:hypothetical protein